MFFGPDERHGGQRDRREAERHDVGSVNIDAYLGRTVNNRDGKLERLDDIIVTWMMKSQFHKWQGSFVRHVLMLPEGGVTRWVCSRLRVAQCFRSQVFWHTVSLCFQFFFFEEEDWLLDICAVNVTCG